MPIIESALGAFRAYKIATASKNVVALTIGLEDYTADIGAVRTKDGRESLWARGIRATRALQICALIRQGATAAFERGAYSCMLI